MKRTPMIAAGFGLAVVLAALGTGRLAADDAKIWPTTTTTTQPQPSFLDKIGSGTKSVFTTTTDVLTLKKFRTSTPAPPASPQQKSWWQKTFGPKDPPPPKTVKEWLSLPRSDP